MMAPTLRRASAMAQLSTTGRLHSCQERALRAKELKKQGGGTEGRALTAENPIHPDLLMNTRHEC